MGEHGSSLIPVVNRLEPLFSQTRPYLGYLTLITTNNMDVQRTGKVEI